MTDFDDDVEELDDLEELDPELAAMSADDLDEALGDVDEDDPDLAELGLDDLDLDDLDAPDDDAPDDDADDDDLGDLKVGDGLPDDQEDDEVVAPGRGAATALVEDEVDLLDDVEEVPAPLERDLDVDDEVREGEFVCRSCFMAKRESALADEERQLCRDCV